MKIFVKYMIFTRKMNSKIVKKYTKINLKRKCKECQRSIKHLKLNFGFCVECLLKNAYSKSDSPMQTFIAKTCSICLNDFQEHESLDRYSCGHIFHNGDDTDHYRLLNMNNCPICRKPIHFRSWFNLGENHNFYNLVDVIRCSNIGERKITRNLSGHPIFWRYILQNSSETVGYDREEAETDPKFEFIHFLDEGRTPVNDNLVSYLTGTNFYQRN